MFVDIQKFRKKLIVEFAMLRIRRIGIFYPDVAGYIQEKFWHDNQEIHTQDDGSIIFEAEVAGTKEIKFWIMSWGSKAEVLEPESLREEIRSETLEMLETSSKGMGQKEEPLRA